MNQNPPKIAIVICQTPRYQYAWRSVADRLYRCAVDAKVENSTSVILVGSCLNAIAEHYKTLFPSVTVLTVPEDDGLSKEWNYQKKAQMLIAKMRSLGFANALQSGCDYCWSIDSDVIPAINSLTCSIDTVKFDSGRVYGVAACPYPSQGGGGFLCGRGTQFDPIKKDFLPEEEGKGLWQAIADHGWRQRGWLDAAYPAIGYGAIVPTDWSGFGCTLMTREALTYADFTSYDGGGTEDLYVNYHTWLPRGIRIAVVTHAPASHCIRKTILHGAVIMGHFSSWKIERNVLRLSTAYHEQYGETVGHLRVRETDWVDETPIESLNVILAQAGIVPAEKQANQQPTRKRNTRK